MKPIDPNKFKFEYPYLPRIQRRREIMDKIGIGLEIKLGTRLGFRANTAMDDAYLRMQKYLKDNRINDAIDEADYLRNRIKSKKESAESLAKMPDYNKRYDEAFTKHQTKEIIPIFPFINWLNMGLNGGGWSKQNWRS
jgi:hypothetical protein